MLSYARRGSSSINTRTIKSNPDTAFLGYCNWSFSEQYHININEAISMLKNFNGIYIPYYRRVFNEMPRSVLNDFINRHNISSCQISNIYQALAERTTTRIKAF